jgi:hypothetical protein
MASYFIIEPKVPRKNKSHIPHSSSHHLYLKKSSKYIDTFSNFFKQIWRKYKHGLVKVILAGNLSSGVFWSYPQGMLDNKYIVYIIHNIEMRADLKNNPYTQQVL